MIIYMDSIFHPICLFHTIRLLDSLEYVRTHEQDEMLAKPFLRTRSTPVWLFHRKIGSNFPSHLQSAFNVSEFDQYNFRDLVHITGAALARVRGVRPNPSIFGEGFSNPSILRNTLNRIKIIWRLNCLKFDNLPLSRRFRNRHFKTPTQPLYWYCSLKSLSFLSPKWPGQLSDVILISFGTNLIENLANFDEINAFRIVI